MKTLKHIAAFFILAATLTTHAGTIVYTYDEADRLTGVNCNNESVITYDYDKAGNMTDYNVLTDPQMNQPFMIYFTLLHSDEEVEQFLSLFYPPASHKASQDKLRALCYRV